MPSWRRRAGLKTIAASTHKLTGRRLPLIRISRDDAVSQPRPSIVGYSRRMEKGATPGRAGKERPQMSQPLSIEPDGMISWGSKQLLGDPDSNSFIGCSPSLQPIAVEAYFALVRLGASTLIRGKPISPNQLTNGIPMYQRGWRDLFSRLGKPPATPSHKLAGWLGLPWATHLCEIDE